MSYVVYKHTAPNGKVYIGITNRKPEVRWGKNGNGYKRNTYFFQAIQKYGWDMISHEILFDNLPKEKACQIEMDLIKEYDSTNREKGYNISTGGDCGGLGVKASAETRAKLSSAHKGKKLSEAHKKMLSESHKGAGHGGFVKGHEVSDNVKAKIGQKHSIPIICVQTGTVFSSCADASKAMQLCRSAICMNLKGIRRHTKGYSFKYLHEV